MAETRKAGRKAFDICVKRIEAKYARAMDCVTKDKDSMLAFHDFPTAHWQHFWISNPIQSVFATERLGTANTKNCSKRNTTLAIASWKFMETALKSWRRLRGYWPGSLKE